jgi:hypothetical protein
MEAQEAISKRHLKKKYAKLRISPFGFLKMIRCGTCGSGITAEEKCKVNIRNRHEKLYRYYVCCRSRDRDCRER